MISRALLFALLALLCATPPARAGNRLVELPAQGDLSFVPARPDDAAGEEPSALGDVNGDGLDDVALDAYFPDDKSTGSEVVPGRQILGTVRLGTRAPGGFRVRGSAAAAGDVNGDGVDDILSADRLIAQGPQSIVVIFGRGGAQEDVDPRAPGSRGFRIVGEPGEEQQLTGAAAGDVNGDGRDDLLVALVHPNGRGYATVVFGSAATEDVNMTSLGERGYRVENLCPGYFHYENPGGDEYDEGPLPLSLAGAGDVNRDGRDDVLVGTGRSGDEICSEHRGEALLLFGKPGTSAIDARSLGSAGVRISGPRGTGEEVAGGSDVNGDGRPDVLLSSPGGATVLFGPRSARTLDVQRPGRRAFAITGSEGAGHLSMLGDVNGDRRGDIAIGVHVVHGPRPPRRISLGRLGAGGWGVRLANSGAADLAAGHVAPAGDVNGDRRADVLVAPTTLGPGGAYALFGGGPPLVRFEPFRERAFVPASGRGRFRLLCPANTVRRCSGRVRVALARGSKATFLRARFRAQVGRIARVAGRLPRRISRSLARGNSVPVRAVVSARDGRGRRALTRRLLWFVPSRPPR